MKCTWKGCPKNLSDKRALKKHLSIHANYKRFRCAVCRYAATQKTTLKKHILTRHIKKRCPICGKSVNPMDSHIMSHCDIYELPSKKAEQLIETSSEAADGVVIVKRKCVCRLEANVCQNRFYLLTHQRDLGNMPEKACFVCSARYDAVIRNEHAFLLSEDSIGVESHTIGDMVFSKTSFQGPPNA